MIGYYVHHQGRGHLHRAIALAEAVEAAGAGPVCLLSSLPRPAGWAGGWVRLPPDDGSEAPDAVTAGGQLHWAPRHDPGVRERAAAVSAWIARSRPRVVVVDVSVEVAALVRLHGVPVVTVVLPGRRTDPAHLLGYRLSEALVSFSPIDPHALLPGLPRDLVERVRSLGAISRFTPGSDASPSRSPQARAARRVVALAGRGGGDLGVEAPEAMARRTPGWSWTVLGGAGPWVDDVGPHLVAADVVVTHAGEGALADVAAHRRPAVVVPAARPHDEQRVTAQALRDAGWPVVVADRPDPAWGDLLDRAVGLDGAGWERWCDGRAAERLLAVLAGLPRPPAGAA